MRERVALIVALALVPAMRASAQDPPILLAPTDPVAVGQSEFTGRPFGEVDFGGRFTYVTGDEARYERYRDLRSGVYATSFLYGQRREGWNVEGQAWHVGYLDQKYQVELQRVGSVTASFVWDQIPLFMSSDTRTLYAESQIGVFRLQDNMQQEIQAGTRTLRNFEDDAAQFDLRTRRLIGRADMGFRVTPQTDLSVQITSTNRNGAIPFGGTFGFNDAVELPVPVDTQTTDVRTAIEWASAKGLLRVGWDGSQFTDNAERLVWDNPLRYGPDISGGPSQGRMTLWPSNTLTYLHGTGAFSFPLHGRVTGYVALGNGKSNEPLLPFTSNTAFAPIPLDRATAQGEQQTTVTQVIAAMRPLRLFSLTARYRFVDVDVQTPTFFRPNGTVSDDSSFSATASPSEYHSVKRNTFDVDGAIQILPSTSIKVGYSALGADYTHRIWETTSENVFRISADITGNRFLMLRALYEDGERRGDGFEPGALQEVGELSGMRHFDVSDRDRQRFTLVANVTPGGIFGFHASAGVGRDDYPEGTHGLLSYESNQASVGFDVAPGDRYAFAFSYGWDTYNSLQRSRNASNATDQANPTRDWTTDYTGKVHYADASFDVNHVIERTLIQFSAEWNKTNDTYFYGLATGSPLVPPAQLPPVRNQWLRTTIDFTYELTRNLKAGLAYWYEDYYVEDFALGPDTLTGIALPPVEPGVPVVATNALLLGYLYRPYTAHTGFVRLTYLW